jgi:hypothetical protein
MHPKKLEMELAEVEGEENLQGTDVRQGFAAAECKVCGSDKGGF